MKCGVRPLRDDRPTYNPPIVTTLLIVACALVFFYELSLDDYSRWWSYIAGANWRHPLGPKSNIIGQANYPVVQIAYEVN